MSAFLLYSKQNSLDHMIPMLDFASGQTLPKEDISIVIQWGASHKSSQDPSIHVLNGAEGLENVSSPKIWIDLLKWNGIPTFEGQSYKFSTIRRYFVPVFMQQELALYKARGKRIWLTDRIKANVNDTYEEIEINRTEREIRRVLQYAVRSIYAVGLDFGGVLLGVGLNGKIKVLDVTPTPGLDEELAGKFAKFFSNYVSQYEDQPSQTVMLGADPEFVLRNRLTGKMVLASRFFGKKGRVGCDQIWLRSDQTHKSLPLAELRPLPSKDPRQLTINLYKTMLLAERKINHQGIEWLAGGMPFNGYPIGGHIHFSQLELNSSLLRALDSYLTLPVMLLENEQSLNRRPKYGFFGDFRKQFHGGFEYRTLPSWLVSPRITKAVFSLAKLIAESYPMLNQLPILNPSVQAAFYQGDKKRILSVVKSIWGDLEQLSEYKRYAKYIEPFKELVWNAWEWDEFLDIREAWRIHPYSIKSRVDMI